MQIDISTAKKLINNYKQNHWTVINGSCPSLHANPNFPHVQDSRSVWFSIDDLQDFIDRATDGGADGVRFYFGEYSQDIIDAELQKGIGNVMPDFHNYTGLHTLVLIPTALDNAGISRDFNMQSLANIKAADGTTVPHFPSAFSNQDMAAENHGSLTPPPYYVGGNAPNIGQDFMFFCDSNP